MSKKSQKKAVKDFGVDDENTPKIRKKKFKCSFLTILLFIFLAQLAFGVVVNSAKIYSLRTKIVQLKDIEKAAQKKNQYLREELEKYTSNTGVEALARNRLQFSKEDETLIIIKNNGDNNNEND